MIVAILFPNALEELVLKQFSECYRSDATFIGQWPILLAYEPPEAELLFINRCYSDTKLQIGSPMAAEVSLEEMEVLADYGRLCLGCEIKAGAVMVIEAYSHATFTRIKSEMSLADDLGGEVFVELIRDCD